MLAPLNKRCKRCIADAEGEPILKKKRLARVIIAAVVTTAILVAIIVGCGPKWGDGSAKRQRQ